MEKNKDVTIATQKHCGGGAANFAKPYERARMEVVYLSATDVVRTSFGTVNDDGENDPFVKADGTWRKW